MAGEGLFFTAAVVYGLIAIVKRAAKVAQQQRGQLDMSTVSGGRSRPPQTMEELLQEMRGQLDGARRHKEIEEATVYPGLGRRPPTAGPGQRPRPKSKALKRLPPSEVEPWDVEEGESLEVEAREISSEEIGARPLPAPIDYDDEASALVQRRIDEAERRNGALVPEDHRRFDAAIRTTTPAAVPPPENRALALRRAMIWHEVLSPPLSLRDSDGPR